MLFQTPAQIQTISTLVDGGNKLSIFTQELSPEEMTKLFSLRKKLGWFVFKEEAIEKEDLLNLTEIKKEFKGEKRPAERLRNTLYIFWEQNGSQGSFDDFYKSKIEEIILKVKEKLQ